MAPALIASWEEGYAIAELWGRTAPVTRATSRIEEPHPLLWGILSIAEYQIDRGAGQKYLIDRLRSGDWLAIGYRSPRQPDDPAVIIPADEATKFGRRQSAVGDGVTTYVDARIIHAAAFRAH
ncbi:hypothetical protein [Bosea sp. R86505]|uniref:hypothetical protein n=1 Tax=Bosea sp. R86505 TaxID=3101710 RepID=UPI0036723A3D